jgi:hypothetical protein
MSLHGAGALSRIERQSRHSISLRPSIRDQIDRHRPARDPSYDRVGSSFGRTAPGTVTSQVGDLSARAASPLTNRHLARSCYAGHGLRRTSWKFLLFRALPSRRPTGETRGGRERGRMLRMDPDLLGFGHRTGVRLAAVGFLLVVIAGVWLVAGQIPRLSSAPRGRSLQASRSRSVVCSSSSPRAGVTSADIESSWPARGCSAWPQLGADPRGAERSPSSELNAQH